MTKSAAARHSSGLVRVNRRLREELGAAVVATGWPTVRKVTAAGDWWITTELFSETERPGLGEFLRSRTCKAGAVFPDAIPLKLPHIAWPQAVARHPSYMKLLAKFDRVWAISQASRQELLGYWGWLALENVPPVEVLPLGADLGKTPRATASGWAVARPALLCVGIIEPRKNQAFLLDVCEELWGEGLRFELHLVGRVNAQLGAALDGRIKKLCRRNPQLRHHKSADDAELASLYAGARATVFPTIAEGCGLPLLESLWAAVPCVCSDLPVLRENADGGGCLPVTVSDHAAWRTALRRVVTDEAFVSQLAAEARSRPLPTWADTAAALRSSLAHG